jgi:hypothetical protein
MQRIIIEVDDAVGKAYKEFSPEGKKQFNLAISLLLKKVANQNTHSDYRKLLDDIGNEAIKNGLTTEILDELLKAND